MAGARFNRNFNVNRVISRLMRAILALYVGGTVLSAFGTAMNATCSALYTGLTLIGWEVGTSTCAGVAGTANTIHATSGGGVLSVIGIVTIAQVITEFITF